MAEDGLVGAGSTVLAQDILGDVPSNPGLADSETAPFDSDAECLATSEIMARWIGTTLA